MSFIRNTSPRLALPADAVGVVLCLGQSNTEGTNALLSDIAVKEPWMVDQTIANAYMWDKCHRLGDADFPNEAYAYTRADSSRSGADAVLQFRPHGINWGRTTTNLYFWELSVGMPTAETNTGMDYTATMADRLVRATRRPIYVMRCAKGSTGLYQDAAVQSWNLNQANASLGVTGEPEVRDNMWALAREMYWTEGIKWILANVYKASDPTTLVTITDIHLLGVVLFLGAYDAADATRGAAYSANLDEFLNISAATPVGPREFLSDGVVGKDKNDVPLVLVRSENYFNLDGTNHAAPHPAKPEIDTVRTAQAAHAATIIAAPGEAVLVSSDGFPRTQLTSHNSTVAGYNMGEHLLATGAHGLGGAIAEGIISLTPLQSPNY